MVISLFDEDCRVPGQFRRPGCRPRSDHFENRFLWRLQRNGLGDERNTCFLFDPWDSYIELTDNRRFVFRVMNRNLGYQEHLHSDPQPRVGFDWVEAKDVLDKIAEEAAKLSHEIKINADKARVTDELGDLLFAVTNLARKLEVGPEQALRGGNAKFKRRFKRIEQLLRDQERTPKDADLDEMEALWV